MVVRIHQGQLNLAFHVIIRCDKLVPFPTEIGPKESSLMEVAVIYKVFGPYRIRRDGRLISKTPQHLRAFWSEIEAETKALPYACGCYVFSIRRRAWYVGLAEKHRSAESALLFTS